MVMPPDVTKKIAEYYSAQENSELLNQQIASNSHARNALTSSYGSKESSATFIGLSQDANFFQIYTYAYNFDVEGSGTKNYRLQIKLHSEGIKVIIYLFDDGKMSEKTAKEIEPKNVKVIQPNGIDISFDKLGLNSIQQLLAQMEQLIIIDNKMVVINTQRSGL